MTHININMQTLTVYTCTVYSLVSRLIILPKHNSYELNKCLTEDFPCTELSFFWSNVLKIYIS